MIMVVLAAIFVVTPVLAGAGRTMEVAVKKPTRMFMTATIEQGYINPNNVGQIYVEIYMTNRAFIQYRGDSVWVEIDEDTLCLDWVKTKRKSKAITIDCSDLNPDLTTEKIKVNIKAKVLGEDANGDPIIVARRVVIKQRSIRH